VRLLARHFRDTVEVSNSGLHEKMETSLNKEAANKLDRRKSLRKTPAQELMAAECSMKIIKALRADSDLSSFGLRALAPSKSARE